MLRGRAETIHKTVRFTQEQVDLINSQGQDNFTANLDHLLGEFSPSSESERGRRIRIEQENLRSIRGEMARLIGYLRVCRAYACSLEDALGDALDLEAMLREEGIALSVPHPGRWP